MRELCIFSPHSVIRDPPFSRIDLVSCRNLLIYFGADVQNQVIPTFHYALRPDGYLFLGSAENVSQFDDLFAPIEKKHRIFRRRSDVAPRRSGCRSCCTALQPGQVTDLTPRRPPLGGVLLRQAVDEQVLERFAPPHVVVNRDGDVVYYSNTDRKISGSAGGRADAAAADDGPQGLAARPADRCSAKPSRPAGRPSRDGVSLGER